MSSPTETTPIPALTSPPPDALAPTAKRHCGSLKKRLPLYILFILLVTGSVVTYAALHGHTQAKLLYYQYQVERLDLANGSSNRIVYRVSPAIAIAADPRQFLAIEGKTPEHHATATAPASGDDDDCEILPPHVIPPGGAGDPPDLDMFNQYAQSILDDDMQVLFAHQLTAANGPRPIVIVQAGLTAGSSSDLEFKILLIDPAGWYNLPRVTAHQRIGGFAVGVASEAATFYAGQNDPVDPAKFHLAIDQGAKHITLTGHLAPDGRSATLQRDPS